jgi:hypothetical protein
LFGRTCFDLIWKQKYRVRIDAHPVTRRVRIDAHPVTRRVRIDAHEFGQLV